MKLTIIWTDQATDDLAEIWLATKDQAMQRKITFVADKVELFISAAMQERLNDLVPSVHYLQINPLLVVFDFSPLDRMVKIIGIERA